MYQHQHQTLLYIGLPDREIQDGKTHEWIHKPCFGREWRAGITEQKEFEAKQKHLEAEEEGRMGGK
jgi:hypothetical protein